MNKYIIGSKGMSINLDFAGVDGDKVFSEILSNQLLFRFITDFSDDGKVVDSIKIENLNQIKVNLEISNTYISGRYGTDFNSTDIIVLCDYLLERYRQEKGIYTIHSSAVFKENNGIMIVANLTGAGKTSTALSLVNKYGFRIFSDEKTLISGSDMVGQVKKIFLEDKTRSSLFTNDIQVDSEISINKEPDKKIKIIIVPMIVEEASEVIVREYTRPQLKWMLYEEMSKDIRLVNGMIFNMSEPLMPLDAREIAQQRLKHAAELSNVKGYLVQGNLESVTNKINSLFQSGI